MATGDKWQSKTLFLSIFDSCSLIVLRVFDCCIPCQSLDFIVEANTLNSEQTAPIRYILIATQEHKQMR